MSKRARLAVEEALVLLEGSEGEDEWSKSEDEDDGDDTYLPDPLEMAQLEVGNGEQSLNDSDMHQTNTDSDETPKTVDTDREVNTQSENDQQTNADNIQTNTCDATRSHDSGTDHIDGDTEDGSHSSSSTTPIAPFLPPPFTEQAGPHHNIPGTASVEEFFLLIFGENFFQVLAEQCNLYASQQPPGSSYNWIDTTENEIKLFLGIHLAMGVHKLPSVEDYWSLHPLLGAPGIVQGMSIRRFKALQSCLHLNDNSKAKKRGEPGYDKLYKIRPMVESIRANCRRYYRLHREISIDEAMVGFKGRSSMKQYCPMKPTKRGYKVWALCDAHNGYLYNFEVYCGATPGATEHGLGATVVRNLSEPVLEKAHFVFFDNYFSSVPLAAYLRTKNTYCVATTRADRVDWPTPLKAKKQLNHQLKRGEHRSVIVAPGVQCLLWKDKKAIPFINTTCEPSRETTVMRKKKDGSRITVPCPQSVQLYNSYMGGVDVADQLRKTYSCRRKSKKWWLPLFYFMVDVSVVNSYILHRETPHTAKHTLKEFILELSSELMSCHCSRKRSAQSSLDAPPSARFCGRHFPSRNGKLGQCRICCKDGIRRRVVYCCLECDPKGPVFLCAEPCFRLFHTKD